MSIDWRGGRCLFLWILMSFSFAHGQQTSTVIEQLPICNNESYVIPLFSTRIIHMTFNQSRLEELNIHTIHLRASFADFKVAEFEGHHRTIKNNFRISNTTDQYNNQSIIIYPMKIHGTYMNQTSIDYSIVLIDQEDNYYEINCSVVVVICEPKRLRDVIFKRAIPFIITIVSIQMGMLLDIEILKELARRPTQILIGFVCQYGLMPMLAFGITKIFHYPDIFGLGLFVIGCCPGGTQSNQWAVVFDGDLNLSTFMSFASTVASFVMMPLWLYTLGEYAYLRQLNIRIPFANLVMSLLTIIGPLVIGMFLVYMIPTLKVVMKRIVKPILIAMILYFFVFGALVNFYLIHYLDFRTALTAPLLPWLGFLLGGTVAWLCRQDWKRTMTIGIETGIQNIGIGIMVLLYSLPSPTNTQSTVIPIIVAYLSPQPFYLILLYQLIRRKCCASEKEIHHRISIDTLSKTTHHLTESEPALDLPVSLLGISPDCQPLEIK